MSGEGKKALALVNLETDLMEENNRLSEPRERVGERSKLHRQWIASVGNESKSTTFRQFQASAGLANRNDERARRFRRKAAGVSW